MAQLDQFDLRVERASRTSGGGMDSSASDTMFNVSRMAGDFAARMGSIANKRAVREGVLAGEKAAAGVEMPNIEYMVHGNEANPLGLIASAGHNPDIKGIRQEARTRFASLQTEFGVQLAVNSGFRDEAANAKAGGAKKSQHIKRNALDIDTSDLSIDERKRLISLASTKFPGIGIYENSIHLDIAGRRAWGPDYHKESVPEWARDSVATHLANGFASPAQPVLNNKLQANITGHMGAMTLKEPGTLYGDAYNQAALSVYTNRLETSARAQLDALSLAHEDNPAKLDEAIDAWAAGQMDNMPDQIKPQFQGLVARNKVVAMRQAARLQSRNLGAQHTAEIESNLAVRETDLFRLSLNAGMDETSDKIIGAELEDYERAIDASGMTQVMAGRAKRKIRTSVVEARVLGHFDNLATAGARQEFAATFQEEWKSGKGISKGVSADSYNRMAAGFSRRIKSDEIAASKHSRKLTQTVDGLMGRLKKGFAVPDAELAQMQAMVNNSGNEQLGETWEFFSQLNDWSVANRQARPEQVQGQIDSLRANMDKEGASERGIEALNVMTGLQKEIAGQLKADPLTWAERAGLLQVENLDVTNADTMIASLKERGLDAKTVGEHYGQPARYFKKAEVTALKARLSDNPQMLTRFSKSIQAALGEDTPAALAELSDEAPLLAHVAGLVNSNQRDDLLDEVSHTLSLRQIDGYKSTLPKQSKLTSQANEVIGMALSQLPKTKLAAIDMATALLESRANGKGLDGEDFDSSYGALQAEYMRSINDALGAKNIDGEQVGGLGEVNGTTTLLPMDMSSRMVEQSLEMLNAADLNNLETIVSANGIPVRANQIKNGHLVAVAPGRYRVALGDPSSDQPKWVMGERDFWILDLNKVKAAQDRRPQSNPEEILQQRYNPAMPGFEFQLGG